MNSQYKVKLSPVTLKIRKRAKTLYSRVPYHDWPHIEACEKVAFALCHRFALYGVVIDYDKLFASLYLHDIGYAIPHLAFHDAGGKPLFISKEHFHATVAMWILENEFGFSRLASQEHGDIITATNPLVKPKTLEQIALRAVDLRNVGGSFKGFLANWQNLKAEAELVNNTKLSQKQWAHLAIVGLAQFLLPELHITPRYYNRNNASAYHQQAVSNLSTLVGNLFGGRDRIKLVAQVKPYKLPILLDDAKYATERVFYVGIDDDTKAMGDGMVLTQAKFREATKPPFYLFVPGAGIGLPLANATVDELVYRNTAIRNPKTLAPWEAKRVLRPNGQVRIIETYSPDGACNQTMTVADQQAKITKLMAEHGGFYLHRSISLENWGFELVFQMGK